ncbi:DUF2231 domain-containing protein [Pengzhenrongella frigida]|uniref:DUF2231 domain-containing protein n=1 Tax=Pengzhenrongella frigida TaxID=1259133 RepID=A0A4Q5MVN9_9MICO|nr:DUF2231 domain-containing protein [Cellulomonas sp. HLT2-17]RYV49682.1 DUF2231 domain-containing protein [Cellulomonas sp. HLT2-17]
MVSDVASTDRGGRARSPWLVSATQKLENLQALDSVARPVQHVVQAALASSGREGLLRGRPIGHALHPLLTDAPLGAWMSASALDVVGGRTARPAARLLIGLGVLTSVPTALTGLAEWAATDGRDRRVGLLHAGVNLLALNAYIGSWSARGRDAHAFGVALAVTGGLLVTVSGYLGGHLTVARKVGSRDPAFTVTDDDPAAAI